MAFFARMSPFARVNSFAQISNVLYSVGGAVVQLDEPARLLPISDYVYTQIPGVTWHYSIGDVYFNGHRIGSLGVPTAKGWLRFWLIYMGCYLGLAVLAHFVESEA